MNELKEIFESISTRIRSPYFGYFVLFSIVINWEAWLVLIFDNSTIYERIDCFEIQTTWWSLFFAPLLLGVLAAIATPWTKLFFVWAAKTPVTKRNIIQVKAESKIIEEKSRLKKAMASIVDTEEENLIARTKRDLEVKSIEDAEAREKLSQQIHELRSQLESSNNIKLENDNYKEPQLNLYLKKPSSDEEGYRIYLSNNGNSVAYNATFELLKNADRSSPLKNDYNVVFPVSELHPGDQVSVLVTLGILATKWDAIVKWESPLGAMHTKNTVITLSDR